jgi:hypothetical protein
VDNKRRWSPSDSGAISPALPLAERLLPTLPQPKIDRFSKDRLQRRIAVVRQAVQRPGKLRIEIADDRPLPDPRLFLGAWRRPRGCVGRPDE